MMGKSSLHYSSDNTIPAPVQIGKSVLSWSRAKEWIRKSESWKIIDDAKKALSKMPEGKKGIVLGSGGNTEIWKKKGWKTLDIKLASKADYIVDANKLEKLIMRASQDFLLAEFISFDPTGKKGVIAKKLIQQSNKVLKIGGILIIETGHHEGYPWPDPLPNKTDFANLMANNGFQTVLELHKVEVWAETVRMQDVVYYGKKLIHFQNTIR
jgi:hypothetical protein